MNNCIVSRCWKRIAIHRKLSKQKRQKAKGPLDNGNHAEKNMQLFCNHCYKQGHLVDKRWNLHPTSHPRHLKKVERDFEKNGKDDSIIDVAQDDTHDEVWLKEAPLKWFGKRWLDFLTN